MEFPKSFNTLILEKKWYNKWQECDLFSANNQSNKPPYSILMPPPNVTGILHFGHVLNLTIQDIYIRFKRMQGYEVCWFPGIDHAGIATQTKVESELRKQGVSRYDLGREKFTEKIWDWKNKYGDIILEQMRKLGISVDWNRVLFTMDASASKAVTEVFIRLFDAGLIYKGKRIINWSPLAQTALSDEEVIFKEVQGHLYTLRYYFEEETEEYLLLSTVRPETIFGDTAVAVNPNDERYKTLVGKKVKVPLTNRYIEIITDDYADPKFGTGCVKITPAHDANDFLVGERHNLDIIQTINPDGTLNELTGEYNGIDRFESRKLIIKRLEEENYVEKIETYVHNVGFSERGGEPIEPYLSDQWFVKMQPLVADAIKVVKDGEIKFHPSHWIKTYEHWLTNVRDWCISRQLWWGHRIPVYYTAEGLFTAANTEEEARKKLNLSSDVELKQDEDSLDTWFSSWLWPLSTMRWLTIDGDTDDMKKFLPTDLLVTAPEIIFFWVARMIIATKYFNGNIPFKNVYFTSIIRDAQGRKLSKSLGNSPDPLNIIAKYGADAVRFSMAYLAPLGQDVRMDVDIANQDIASMEIGRNFANKVWNAGRFIQMKNEEINQHDTGFDADAKLSYADKWILSRYNSTIVHVNEYLNNYKVTEYSKVLYDFIWRDFCDWYVEVLKVQFNNSENANYKKWLARFATELYGNILKLLHPLMPFITEEIYHIITEQNENKSITNVDFPNANINEIDENIETQFELIQSIVEEIRKLRATLNIPYQKLPALISVIDKKQLIIFNDLKAIIMSICKFNDLSIAINIDKPNVASSIVYREITVHLIVKEAIDVDKEKQRLEKEINRLEGNIKGSENKLNNEKFINNASTEIVTKEREKLISMQESLKKVRQNLVNLK